MAWPWVSTGFDWFVAGGDDLATTGMRLLADHGVVSGESGACTVGALAALAARRRPRRRAGRSRPTTSSWCSPPKAPPIPSSTRPPWVGPPTRWPTSPPTTEPGSFVACRSHRAGAPVAPPGVRPERAGDPATRVGNILFIYEAQIPKSIIPTINKTLRLPTGGTRGRTIGSSTVLGTQLGGGSRVRRHRRRPPACWPHAAVRRSHRPPRARPAARAPAQLGCGQAPAVVGGGRRVRR